MPDPSFLWISQKRASATLIISREKKLTVVMRKEWWLYSVSSIGVLPFIEGSLGDGTSGLVAGSRDSSSSEEHAWGEPS